MEADHFNTDLNGDGDTDDIVLGVDVLKTSQSYNTGLAISPWDIVIQNEKILVGVPEKDQFNKDLNDDGDADDCVLHIYDPDSLMKIKNLKLAAGISELEITAENFTYLLVHEDQQGAQDLNGDFDHEDSVLHLFDFKREKVVNLKLALRSFFPDIETSLTELTVPVLEKDQNEDLNGDGDMNDEVLFYISQID